jgi:hypothetical protein
MSAELHEFRATARKILRDEHLPAQTRTRALLRLYRLALQSADPEWAIRAIVAEIGWDIDRHYTLSDATYGEPLERRHRQLRAAGYGRCPECWSQLSNEIDWTRWRDLREAAIAELEAREGATG